jgi:uncharacterized protein (DUF433 family)
VGVEKENAVARLVGAASAFGSLRHKPSTRSAGKWYEISSAAAGAPISGGRANFGRAILTAERWTPNQRVRPNMEFTRITADCQQLGGVPCIRRLRIPVATVVGMVSEGMTTAEILEAYPDLVEDDVREALQFAAVGRPLQI